MSVNLAPFTVEGSKDARRQMWWTAAVDELEQGMEVHGIVTRELRGGLPFESRNSKAGFTPGDIGARGGAGLAAHRVVVHVP
jgi:hypothetical protein